MTTDVVFTFSFETLADARRRGMMRPPDRVLTALADDARVGGLLVADPFRSAPVRLVRRLTGDQPDEDPSRLGDRRLHLVQPLRLRRHDRSTVAPVARAYRRYDARLQRAVEQRQLRAPVLVTFHPLVAAHAPARWASRIVYYGRDDWTVFPPHRRWWPVYRDAYRRIAERGATVCAVSEPVLARIDPTGPGHVVPNGVSPHEWTDPPPDGGSRLAGLPRPVALYTGTIDSRLDLDMVAAVAAGGRVGTVALAGPVGDAAVAARLADLPGVELLGPLSRDAVVATVFDADLCLVPHRRTPLTEAMSPLKLYEYLAAGRPVVATDLPPMRGVHDHVLLRSDGVDVETLVAEALDRGPMPDAERRRVVEQSSWRRRLTTVLDAILEPGSMP